MTIWVLPENCPPIGAALAVGNFYRLVGSNLKKGEIPHKDAWKLPLEKKKSENYRCFEDCHSYAHSIFNSIDTLLNARSFVAWARNRAIAEIDLGEGNGRMLETPSPLGSGHMDWWPEPLDFIPLAVVVEEGA